MFTTHNNMGCKCPHHTIVSVLMLLSWVAAIGYFMAYWFGGYIYIFDVQYFFEVAVMLSVIALTTRFCTCCNQSHCNNCHGANIAEDKKGVMMCCMDSSGNCMHVK